MNLVILIDSAQMFFRNFGFRHATAALGAFAVGLAGGPGRRTEMTATLQRMVRDPRTGEVHLPHEPLSIIRTMENLGRTLIKIKWQAGGESVLLPDDIDSYYTTADASRNSRQKQS
jgi:hypothetical protein